MPKFKQAAAELIKIAVPSIRVSSLLKEILRITGEDEVSRALCSQLVSLATFRRTEKVSEAEVIDGLIEGIAHAELPEAVHEWFVSCRDDLIQLLQCPSIKLPAKALQLSTDYEKVFESGNVVTDVRPVFDDDREAMMGAIIGQVLRIHYLTDGSQGRPQEISLALDLDDIEKLIAELEKSRTKAESAKQQLSSISGSEIFVVGEETYGFG
ncbi:hypothetical protein [Vannielia sp. SX4]|uniref:hypothetical protein n=1 Tax=Vannielia sp. SX4 TaxID=3463852 RepID=UPI0040589DA5